MEYLEEGGPYPTEESLDTIRNWSLDRAAWPDLMEYIRPYFAEHGAWHKRRRKSNDLRRKWVTVYSLATGGWSGCEEIIVELQYAANRMFWACCWRLSRAGGYYEFEVNDHG